MRTSTIHRATDDAPGVGLLGQTFRLVASWWHVILAVGILTAGVGFVIGATSDTTYTTTSQYVVVPAPSFRRGDPDDLVRNITALDNLTIVATASEIMNGDVIADDAAAAAGIDDPTPYHRDASVVPGSSVIRLEMSGPDAEAVAAFSSAIGEGTRQFVAASIAAYELRVLDPADVPRAPSSRSATTTALLGMMFGIGLAVAVIIIFEPRRRSRDTNDDLTDAFDEVDLGRSTSHSATADGSTVRRHGANDTAGATERTPSAELQTVPSARVDTDSARLP